MIRHLDPVSLLVSSWKEYAEEWDVHIVHSKAISSAYDVDLMSMIQIDDLHEGDAAYLRCGLLLNHRLGHVYQNGNRRLFSQSLCLFPSEDTSVAAICLPCPGRNRRSKSIILPRS